MKKVTNKKQKLFTFLALFSLIEFQQLHSFAAESLNLVICPSQAIAIYDSSGIKKYNCQQTASLTWKELVVQNPNITNARLSTLKSGSLSVRPVGSVLGTFGIEIAAEIQMGQNECEAKGMTVQLFKARKKDVIFVMPAIVKEKDVPKMCRKDFNPVFKRAFLTISAPEEIKAVIIQNLIVDQRQP